jgi:hypothetical protein
MTQSEHCWVGPWANSPRHYQDFFPGPSVTLSNHAASTSHVTKHLRILPACPRWHMKGMIGIRKQLQRCTPAELFVKRHKLIQPGFRLAADAIRGKGLLLAHGAGAGMDHPFM